jgi:hypothetical protein
VVSIDGARLLDLLVGGLNWLDRHHQLVNSLNVFPVPDGDTGTNMLLTLRSAVREIQPEHLQSAGEVARAAAQGALMGARGNSGVILSQILRGMARSIDGQSVLSAPSLAAALSEGSRVAYKGVNRPVEGTILTVAREAAEAAIRAASQDVDLRATLRAIVEAADLSVANTPRLLPVLAQTGKVDSGGKGLFFILEGMYRELVGLEAGALTAEGAAAPAAAAPGITVIEPPRRKGARPVPEHVYGFDVQFLVEAPALDIDEVRRHITEIGECPLVEGDDKLLKVHVHVPDPGAVLSYAVSLGFVTDVVVENMDDMHLPGVPSGPVSVADSPGPAEVAPPPALPESIEGPGVVAVAPGAGLAQVFRSLGAHVVVSGGQTMNPSTQELLEAIRSLPTDEVIVLPNNGNVVMAAQQAAQLARQSVNGTGSKRVVIVPAKTIPQGISALLGLHPHAMLDRNAQTMGHNLGHVRTGEVTRAVHDAEFDGIPVRSGDIIGLVDDMLTAKGASPEEVVGTLLGQMDAEHHEVISLYYGQEVDSATADLLQASLQDAYPDQEVEMVYGGQPLYHYIISVE